MFRGFQNGFPIIVESFKVFKRHPKLLTPLIFTWCFYAPMIIFMEYLVDWDRFQFHELLMILFGVIFLFAFFLSFSCSVLMELIRQIEFGEPPSFLNAVSDSGSRNLAAIMPVVFLWSTIWFIVSVLEAFLSKFRRNKHKDLNAENVAKTLGGWDVFSWPRLLFYYFEKAIRMIMFLIIPSVVWHDPNFFTGFKEAMQVLKKHPAEFVAGFVITEAASAIVFLPPTVMFILSSNIKLPDFMWIVTIFYIAFAWSYSMYLEQMYVAELYLWHRQWCKEVLIAKEMGKSEPRLQDVKRPSLLDDGNALVI